MGINGIPSLKRIIKKRIPSWSFEGWQKKYKWVISDLLIFILNNNKSIYYWYNRMPFNPITLEYENSKSGESLKKKDEMAKVRGYVRAENLDTRSNCGYNILTGKF